MCGSFVSNVGLGWKDCRAQPEVFGLVPLSSGKGDLYISLAEHHSTQWTRMPFAPSLSLLKPRTIEVQDPTEKLDRVELFMEYICR